MKTESSISQNYLFIAILDSVKEEDESKTLSSLDCQPDYLHIHILADESKTKFNEYIDKIKSQTPSPTTESSSDSILFQWGLPIQLSTQSRYQTTQAKHLQNFDVGIGSSAIGKESRIKNQSTFCGAGEAFKLLDTNVRVTKGNKSFAVANEEGYWTFQATNSENAKTFNVPGVEIDGRNNLLNFFKDKSAGKPFVAVFNAQFIGEFYSRSNGILNEDLSLVTDSKKTLFEGNESVGGHLVGGTNSQGDLKSLQEKFDLSTAQTKDMKIKFTSELVIIPTKLRIIKENAEIPDNPTTQNLIKDEISREPRTHAEVLKATTLIQKLRREKNKSSKLLET